MPRSGPGAGGPRAPLLRHAPPPANCVDLAGHLAGGETGTWSPRRRIRRVPRPPRTIGHHRPEGRWTASSPPHGPPHGPRLRAPPDLAIRLIRREAIAGSPPRTANRCWYHAARVERDTRSPFTQAERIRAPVFSSCARSVAAVRSGPLGTRALEKGLLLARPPASTRRRSVALRLALETLSVRSWAVSTWTSCTLPARRLCRGPVQRPVGSYRMDVVTNPWSA